MMCTYCSHPALIQCRNHKRYLCGDENCYALHRLSVRPELCNCFEAKRRMEPMDWVVAIGSAIVLGVGVVIIMVHL